MAEHNEHPSSSKYDGLSPEIGKIIRDPAFQTTVTQFRENQTLFRVVKGVGFMLALSSGLFGYFLKANSEADDRKAAALTDVINEKKGWLRRVNDAHLEFRKALALMKFQCGEKNSSNLKRKHDEARLIARYAYYQGISGSAEVFDGELIELLRSSVVIEQKIVDLCHEQTDFLEDMFQKARKANQYMRDSIALDRKKLEELGTGIFNGPQMRF